MYKLIIPALLTASLVGCGSDSGSSAKDIHQPNKGNPESITQKVPQPIAQKEPSLRVNKTPTPVYSNKTPNLVDDEGRIAPPNYKGDTPGRGQLIDPNAQIAPPTYTGDVPGVAQLKDPNAQIAPPEYTGDEPGLAQLKPGAQVAPPEYKGDTPEADQLKDPNAQIAPPEYTGNEPGLAQLKPNAQIAPPEADKGEQPGEDKFIAQLVPAPTGTNPNQKEAVTLDNKTVIFSLDSQDRLDLLLLDVIGEDGYDEQVSLNINGNIVDISGYVDQVVRDENIEVNILQDDLTELNRDSGEQFVQLEDLIGDDGVLRLIVGSHNINLRVDDTQV